MMDYNTDILGAMPQQQSVISEMTIDADKDWLNYDITNIGKITAARTDTPSGVVTGTIEASYIADAQSNVVNTAMYGYIEDTGNEVAGTGHIIGGLFLASNATNSVIPSYGGEFRNNLRSILAGVLGYGGLMLGNFEGTTFNGTLVGGQMRAEVYAADGSTPLAEGNVFSLYIPDIIGGNYNLGIFCKESVRIDNSIQIFDTTGVNYGTISKNLGGALSITSDNNELDLSTLTTISLGGGGLYGTGYTQLGPLKIDVKKQTTATDIGADGYMYIWEDTSDSNRVYLVYRRGAGNIVKVELT